MDTALASLTIGPAATILEAMVAIDRGARNVALVVDDTNRFIGTVSDGDIRRSLIAGGRLDDPVLPCVSRAAVVAKPGESRAALLDLMRARHVSQIPVVGDAGELVGLHLLRELVGYPSVPNVAVIMAGGRGTRLYPITEEVPKPMVRVAGRPILERIILHLVGHGLHTIVLAVNYLADMIEEHFRDGSDYGCDISYLREDPAQPLGTGGALALFRDARPEVADTVLVLNGDLLTEFDAADLLGHHAATQSVATVGAATYTHQVPFGVIETTGDGRVAAIHEKPVWSGMVNAGIYALQPYLFDRIPRHVPYALPQLLSDCLERGEPVSTWRCDDEWRDIGQHADLRIARGEH